MEKITNKNNILLVKDDIGKAKPTTHKLPGNSHIYGKPDIKDNHGARDITSSWVTHEPSNYGK